MQGFGSDADTTHSRLSFNTDRRWIYVYIIPATFATTPPVFVPLEMEIPFEDIVNGGVSVVSTKQPDSDHALVTLTIRMRRPARFYCKIKGKNLMQRGTERDFVFSIGPGESTPGRSVADMKAKGVFLFLCQCPGTDRQDSSFTRDTLGQSRSFPTTRSRSRPTPG